MIDSRKIERTSNGGFKAEMRNAYKDFVGKPNGNNLFASR
jgi:hypothetical protein